MRRKQSWDGLGSEVSGYYYKGSGSHWEVVMVLMDSCDS